ncbi:RidA family protein [Halioxenophilus sp. WMMB6]|uniref:RidA family protein n=1 Tax=Halioxenophilus sp. WMMB6 TaxID=3073815 RepID=UPI00295F40C1|nr:RidA family protein [Halioxenophilus sp. WMMB6]
MTLIRRNSSSLTPPVGPFVHSVQHGNTLYVSGITAFGCSAQQGPIADQTKAVFAQIKLIAEEFGASMNTLIRLSVFVTELDDLDGVRREMFAACGDALPVTSLMQISGLFSPDLKVEIESTFAVPD